MEHYDGKQIINYYFNIFLFTIKILLQAEKNKMDGYYISHMMPNLMQGGQLQPAQISFPGMMGGQILP